MMLAIINDPTLFMRIAMMTISVGTGVGIVVSGITVGVIVTQQLKYFQETTIVLQSPATIVLDRYIDANELPLFYNALDATDVFISDTKKVLNARFGDKFVNLMVSNFSATPKIQSSRRKKFISKRKVLKRSDNRTDKRDFTTTVQASITLTPNDTTGNTTEGVTYGKCEVLFTTSNYTDCSGRTASNIQQASDHGTESPHVVPGSTEIDPSQQRSNYTTTTTRYTSNGSIGYNSTIATISNNTTSQCIIPNDAIGRSSIISSKMLLYFQVKRGESILVQEIIDALKDLKPPIAVFTRCKEPSIQTSSFNQALSNVETPTKVDIDLAAVRNQESASVSLKESVSAAAAKAEADVQFSTPVPVVESSTPVPLVESPTPATATVTMTVPPG
ncbi:unnamed protein product [Rotaria sp. Silwood2]|nr:unnamed protein product [Rotaria sp. Silwood2]CAF2888842.1 unnamed protein product [Rotaria sp. Silwood2]CAF3143252.1 unnamed protein product [Rotaria sp. Silwood2]CAF4098683.1 unnamed protein product [Rotaria sp. Silwood2]CAF4324450.1 unnamed protein product [Rotaria sp. Silwood2]